MDIKRSIADILYFAIILAVFFLYGYFKYGIVAGIIFDVVIIMAGIVIVAASHLIARIWDRFTRHK